jgi:hypothetical protein
MASGIDGYCSSSASAAALASVRPSCCRPSTNRSSGDMRRNCSPIVLSVAQLDDERLEVYCSDSPASSQLDGGYSAAPEEFVQLGARDAEPFARLGDCDEELLRVGHGSNGAGIDIMLSVAIWCD